MQWVKNKQVGFTIVELLIVVVVIAILAAITIVAYNGIQNRARISGLQSELTSAAKSLEAKRLQDSAEQYPSSLTAAGITLSDSTYIYESSDNSYCLTKTSGQLSYYVSDAQKNATAGNCGGDSMVSWWRFNGGNANDSVGTNNGNVINAIPTNGQNGQTEGAFAFNGTNATIDFGNSTSFNQPNFTMSVWVRPASTGSISMFLGKEMQYKYRFSAGGGLNSLVSTNGTTWSNPQPSTSAVAAVNTWTHAVFTYNSSTSTAKLYANGTLLNTSTVSGPITAYNTRSMYAGSTNGASEFLNGSLDDARFYSRVLSAAEVKGLFNAGAQ